MKVPLRSLLVTGCGGDIALAAGRVLRELRIAERLIGCDAARDHAGLSVFDECAVVPRADAADYLDGLGALAARSGAAMILPMTEPELGRLAAAGSLESAGGIPVLAANAEAVETGLDKLKTARLLADRGLAYPWTVVVGEEAPRAFPCMIKKRSGSGGRGLAVVPDAEAAKAFERRRAGDIWQELLLPDQEEYTCGLFRSAAGETRAIALRRTLAGGMTGKAEVRSTPAIDAYLRAIAEALRLRGCVNVQLRSTARGPIAFEINPRLSSTVAFRHRLGFEDLLWALQDRLGLPLSGYRAPLEGMRVYRTYGEFLAAPGDQR